MTNLTHPGEDGASATPAIESRVRQTQVIQEFKVTEGTRAAARRYLESLVTVAGQRREGYSTPRVIAGRKELEDKFPDKPGMVAMLEYEAGIDPKALAQWLKGLGTEDPVPIDLPRAASLVQVIDDDIEYERELRESGVRTNAAGAQVTLRNRPRGNYSDL